MSRHYLYAPLTRLNGGRIAIDHAPLDDRRELGLDFEVADGQQVALAFGRGD